MRWLPLLQFAVLFSSLSSAQELVSSKVNTAVFSKEQTFWPGLAKTSATPKAPLHLVVLPIRIKESDWKESTPCDSCHRLSANGMEFFLENYLTETLRKRFPGNEVDLAAPHLPLVEAAKINLLEYQDSLKLPWDKWFDGYGQEVVYRPRDWMAPPTTKKRLDRLGGLLGATHLLLPARVKVFLDPRARNVHTGHMEWGFHLLFWNVAAGRVEWAMAFSETARNADLDAALDGRLDKALGAAWDRMPERLAALWQAEPQ
jgi:hypothetical protein